MDKFFIHFKFSKQHTHTRNAYAYVCVIILRLMKYLGALINITITRRGFINSIRNTIIIIILIYVTLLYIYIYKAYIVQIT